MPEHDFYITLPSNASMDRYPDNRPGKFKADLSHRHDLSDGQWEIGLTEIQFTSNWRYSTPKFDMVVWLGEFEHTADMHKARPENYAMSAREASLLAIEESSFSLHRHVTAYIEFPAGSWLNEYEFADVLSESMKTALNKTIAGIPTRYKDKVKEVKTVRYVKDTATKRTQFDAIDKHIGVSTDREDIMAILGISPRPETENLAKVGKGHKVFMFNYVGERLLGGFPPLETIFVYSSVCTEQHIGNQTGNLLKTVGVTAEHSKRQCERYSAPIYVRLRPSTLDSIDIQLRDKTGSEVIFDGSSTLVVLQLHVRKCRENGWY
jgi:hypothetical protein